MHVPSLDFTPFPKVVGRGNEIVCIGMRDWKHVKLKEDHEGMMCVDKERDMHKQQSK